MAGPMLKFHNWDLKALKSNIVFKATATEAIFDPQNRQNRDCTAGTEI